MNTNTLIQLAIKEAKKSKGKIKIGCVIFDKNYIIAKGYNSYQKSIKSFTKDFIKWKTSIHAEVATIIKSKTDLKRTSILVVRINNNNNLKLARPCNHCYNYIKYAGIKWLYYSTNDGVIIKEKI